MTTHDYELIDSGFQRKLERFGPYILDRPSLQAVWKPTLPKSRWEQADARFIREMGERWHQSSKLPNEWTMRIDSLNFLIRPTEFGHVGVFVEQRPLWTKIKTLLSEAHCPAPPSVLNLFAYSGGSTLAAALAGAQVCHLDASKGMVDWARKNGELNGLHNAPIRWIVDDAMKFLEREKRRNRRYDAIILDPPSFGRGANKEVFKIEEDILRLLSLVRDLLSDRPLFVLLSCHTAGFTESTLRYLLEDCIQGGTIETGELTLESFQTRTIPNGYWALNTL